MAKIEAWLSCDLKKPVQVQGLSGNVFSMDNNGSRINVRIYDNGEKTTVSGSVTANCILADGSTINVNGSLTTDNGQSVAYVDIPQSCLLVPGPIRIAIKLTASGVITTLAAVVTTVYRTQTDIVITPSAQIITDWNAEISAAIATQNAAIANQDTKINDLKSAFNNNKSPLNYYEAVNDNTASVHGTSYSFDFVAGKTYRIVNVGSVTVSLTTRQDATKQEDIVESLTTGNYVDFTATANANVLRVYWNGRGDGKVLVYYGDCVNDIPKVTALVASDAQHTTDIDSIIGEMLENGRRYLKGNENGVVGYHTSGGNRICSGIEKINLLNQYDACFDAFECVNYDGSVSIGNMTVTGSNVSIQLLFCENVEETYEFADLNNNHKPTTVVSITDLQAQNYEFYTGILYGNAAVRIRFNPTISEIAENLPSGEYYYYALGDNAEFGCGIDGFIPANVTNPLFNGAYPPFTVYREHNWLFAYNDAIKQVQMTNKQKIGTVSGFALTAAGNLNIGFTQCDDNSTHYISGSDTSLQKVTVSVKPEGLGDEIEVAISRYGNNVVATMLIDTTKLISGMAIGNLTTAADNTYAVIVPAKEYKPMNAYNIYAGRLSNSGTYVSDNDYAMYLVPINKDCEKALLYFTALENSKIGLCNESGTIHEFVEVADGFNSVNCKGYSYIVFTASRVGANVTTMGLNYKEDEAIVSIIAAKKIAPRKPGHYQIGQFSVYVNQDGTVYTDENRSIRDYPTHNYPFLDVTEETVTFTNPANNKSYSNNFLMEICRDGTRYYMATREDGASSDYFFPIIWKQNGEEKSLVMGTNENQPADATIRQGENDPDLSGISWLERSNNTLYQNYDSITELSNGELLISLVGKVSDNGTTTLSSVVFVTYENRTVWIPKLICTNQKYSYQGSNYTVFGYPTKNNSIQVFKTRFDTSKDCILISEYGSGTPLYWREKGEDKNGNGVVGRVWMSINSGSTFKKIFDMDEKKNGDADDVSDDNWKWCKSYKGRMATHIHCAYYDPINEMVWITNGDAGTEDGQNSLFYMNMQDLFDWVNTQGEAVNSKTLHPAYTDNEALPSFMQFVMTEQGRDVGYQANALSTGVNFQMYAIYATEKALILGNDASRQIMYGVHNTTINHKRNQSSPNLFVDMFYEIDEANPATTIQGFPQTFYRKDENCPLLCFYSNIGIFASWDGVNWRRVHSAPRESKKIGFMTHVCKDTDGKIVFTFNGNGEPDFHNYKITNY